MAALFQHSAVPDWLRANPLFVDLRSLLAQETRMCAAQPYTLLSMEHGHDASALTVAETNYQKELRRYGRLRCERVTQLQDFYHTQSTVLLMQRNKAMHNDPIRQQQILTYFNYRLVRLTDDVTLRLRRLRESYVVENRKFLSEKAVSVMTEWYEKHMNEPYANKEQMSELASQAGITLKQVKAWLSNKRNRTMNTRPKVMKRKLSEQLTDLCQELTRANKIPREELPRHLQGLEQMIRSTLGGESAKV
ncbi:PREDICTED: pre-B-cell leukemia transcription factor 4-like [Priapulus caudatus]|uniref:Pre-B-cell leukemia transcription factor 4-like n=1 Tax=Priapulus caudatus TaxID=37621 RepID=A0ABM1DYG4_PRICU|nr:PREDICTED: pre-B-cell leukemia transcription factor 4-like [Priapulus caudatus]